MTGMTRMTSGPKTNHVPALYSGQGARFIGLNRGRNTGFGVGILTLLLSEPARIPSGEELGQARCCSVCGT